MTISCFAYILSGTPIQLSGCMGFLTATGEFINQLRDTQHDSRAAQP